MTQNRQSKEPADALHELLSDVTPLPSPNRARIAIKTSREQKTISLFLNGVLTKQWAEPDGFGGDKYAFWVEAMKNLREPLAFLADEIVGRNFQAVDEQHV